MAVILLTLGENGWDCNDKTRLVGGS